MCLSPSSFGSCLQSGGGHTNAFGALFAGWVEGFRGVGLGRRAVMESPQHAAVQRCTDVGRWKKFPGVQDASFAQLQLILTPVHALLFK